MFDGLERAGVMLSREQAEKDVDRIGLVKGRLGITIIDVFMSEHPQYEEMHRRIRHVVDASGWAAPFISPEDLTLHKVVFGRAKDIADLELLIAARPELDLAYVRSWLVQMVPAGDPRLVTLDDLERRFSNRG